MYSTSRGGFVHGAMRPLIKLHFDHLFKYNYTQKFVDDGEVMGERA